MAAMSSAWPPRTARAPQGSSSGGNARPAPGPPTSTSSPRASIIGCHHLLPDVLPGVDVLHGLRHQEPAGRCCAEHDRSAETTRQIINGALAAKLSNFNFWRILSIQPGLDHHQRSFPRGDWGSDRGLAERARVVVQASTAPSMFCRSCCRGWWWQPSSATCSIRTPGPSTCFWPGSVSSSGSARKPFASGGSRAWLPRSSGSFPEWRCRCLTTPCSSRISGWGGHSTRS